MATASQQQIEQLLNQGYQSYKNNQFAQANQTYSFALNRLNDMIPQLLPRYFNFIKSLQGLTFVHLKENQKAMEIYDSILNKDPFNVPTIIRKAVLLISTGQYQQAWIGLQRALIVQPDNARIALVVEQLNAKLGEVKQSDESKYLLKQSISQMVDFPEVQEDMLLNFNNLRLIDKHSFHSNKSVSILNEPTATIEVDKEFDVHNLIGMLVKEVVLSPFQIKEIQKQTEAELDPNRLSQSLTDEMVKYSPIKVLYDEKKNPSHVRSGSILKCHSVILNIFSRSTSNVSQTSETRRRVSALQVKNIDGKIIKHNDKTENEEFMNVKDHSEIEFGQISDIEKLGKKQPPIYKQQNLKRKSSLRKSSSIINRPKERSLFERQKIDLLNIDIDGPIIPHVRESQEHDGQSESTHVVKIKEEPEHLNVQLKQDNDSNCITGIGKICLSKKQSILKKSKLKEPGISDQQQN